MKPKFTPQIIAAEAKVLAMALPMLILSAFSATAKPDDPGLHFPDTMDVPQFAPQPNSDTTRVEPVEKPDQNKANPRFPARIPKGPDSDCYLQGVAYHPLPASPDTACVDPVENPDVDVLRQSIPHNQGDNPEEDGLMVPAIPGNDDIYGTDISDIYFEDQAGISDVAVDQPTQSAQGVFTLSGMFVSNNADISGLAPGLYIVNGKKVLVR